MKENCRDREDDHQQAGEAEEPLDPLKLQDEDDQPKDSGGPDQDKSFRPAGEQVNADTKATELRGASQ